MRRMNITIGTNEREVGSIIADLMQRKGVTIEGVSLVEVLPNSVNKPKGNAGRTGTTSTIELIKFLKGGKPVKIKLIVEKMKSLGFSGTSHYSALTRFLKQGYVKKLADGEYVATESGIRLWGAGQ